MRVDQRITEVINYCEAARMQGVVLAVPFLVDVEVQKYLMESPLFRGLILRNPDNELTNNSTSEWLGCFDGEGGFTVPFASGPLIFVGSSLLLTHRMVAEIIRSRRYVIHCSLGGHYRQVSLFRLATRFYIDSILLRIRQLPASHPLSFMHNIASSSPLLRHIWMRTVRKGRVCEAESSANRLSSQDIEQRLRDFLSEAYVKSQACNYEAVPGRVLLVNSGLAAGGAERQIVNSLLGLRASGKCENVMLLAEYLHHSPKMDFFLHELEASGVEVAQIESRTVVNNKDILFGTHLAISDLVNIEALPITEILNLAIEFQKRRPQIVHAWQDSTSIKVGIAAIIVGVPRVVLASRNMIPEKFSYYQPYMRPAYRALTSFPQVKFLNNSEAGADDYTKWLEIPRDRFAVVRNGVNLQALVRAEVGEIAQYRKSLGIPEAARVIGSVFRFWPEKRPMLWLEVAEIVAEQFPDVHFLVVGEGPMRKDMESFISQCKLCERIHLPGTRTEVSLPLSVMNLFLLTSKFEGTPNVVLEAQWLGLPVVATHSGGTAESFVPGETGLLVESSRAVELASHVAQVLQDERILRCARTEGPRHVSTVFGMERMINQTLALYGLRPAEMNCVCVPEC